MALLAGLFIVRDAAASGIPHLLIAPLVLPLTMLLVRRCRLNR